MISREWLSLLKKFLQTEFNQLERDDVSWITNDMYEIDEDCEKLLEITYNMLKLALEEGNQEKNR